MNQPEFENRYPVLSDVLPADLVCRCCENHPLKICIDRDHEGALEMWSKLVEKSPAREIMETYENNLHLDGKFNAFVAELWCYQALSRWLCENPQVLDRPNNTGMPDFACEAFDVDATLLQEADEEYRIRRKLDDIMGNQSYIGKLSLKCKFDVQATTGDRWAENEDIVNNFISLIEQDLDPNNPKTIETEALIIEFEEKEHGPFGVIVTWDRIRKLDPDDEDIISERLRTKADQPRDGRPMVVFMDCKHTSIDFADEVCDILIGKSYGFSIREEVDISPHIESVSNDWNDYLVDIGAIPDPNDDREIARLEKDEGSDKRTYRPFSAIRPGDEGVFQEQSLERIAGVMLRMKTGDVCYIPNVYTDAIDAKSVFDKLNWGLETRELNPKEL